MEFRDVLFFDKMLTPKLIIAVYWLGILSSLISGLGLMASGSLFGGLGAMLFGIVGARIFCELLIVAFKINEALQEIRTK